MEAPPAAAITGTTRIFGVIGDPVAHSLSPGFQNEFLRQREVDAVYLPFHVAPAALDPALDGLAALGVEGFNVTVPHKESVARRVSLDGAAARIGAVNTVTRGDDAWYGYNTDWEGFRDAVAGLGIDARGAEVLLIGAGGTARAIVHALREMGVARLRVCNRGAERLRRLLAHVADTYTGFRCETLEWNESSVRRAAEGARILINTTSIGVSDRGASFPFSLSGEGVAIDAVYAPQGVTPFTRAASEGGRRAIDGLAMLVAQGAASFRIWHGENPDRLAALRRLERELGRDPLDLPGWEVAA